METYLKSFLSSNDYQSTFLSPKSKEEWDAKFYRSFVGVGISIETTIGYPKIKEVVFGGPAWKTKMLNSGDTILKIAQESGEAVDVAGLGLNTVIDLLKGESGTTVHLTIKNESDGDANVTVERGKVPMSKTMSFMLDNNNQDRKIGYINLPRFYGGDDLGSAADILGELRKLNKEKVEGLIIDLRNNKGGYSSEATQMLGLFLKGGAVMQTLNKDGEINISEDYDETQQFNGKLVVLVNHKSGSASELFSGTLQDYNRALIVGNQTFGKGTMQRFIEIKDELEENLFGEIKVTFGSFYTGLGRSTQYHGVIPDIELPSEEMYSDSGERNIENALKFKNLDSTSIIINSNFEKTIDALNERSNQRVKANRFFVKIESEAKELAEETNKTMLNLNYAKYKSTMNEESFDIQFSHTKVSLEVNQLSLNNYGEEQISHWESMLSNDHELFESVAIMNDYLNIPS